MGSCLQFEKKDDLVEDGDGRVCGTWRGRSIYLSCFLVILIVKSSSSPSLPDHNLNC